MTPVAGSSPCTERDHSAQSRRYWYHNRGGCLGLRRFHRGESSTACLPQDSQPNGQPAFPAVLREPDGVLHASSHRRLKVREQDNRRVHQVDRRLLVDRQEPSFEVISTVRRRVGHPVRRPHRSLARRKERRLHRGGVSAVLPRVRRHQHAAAKPLCPNARAGLCALWFGACSQVEHFSSSM